MPKKCNCGPKDPIEPLIATQGFYAQPATRQIGFCFHVFRGEVRLLPSKNALNRIATTEMCYPVSGCEVVFAGESRNGDTWEQSTTQGH